MNHRQNILIILTDQQRFDTLAAAGYPHMETPNLDRLVREGCLFRNAFSPNPICVPARHCLLTGLTGRFHGYFSNEHQPMADTGLLTLPRVCANAGYHTAALGKSHFIPATEHHGYSELHLMEELPGDVEDDAYARYLREKGYGELRNIHGVRAPIYHEPQDCLVPEEDHGTRWLGREAAGFIRKNAHRPFLLTVGFIHPHPPWNIPEEQRGRYRDKILPEPLPPVRCAPFPKNSWTYHDEESPEAKREIREAYYTSVSMVDDSIGKILEALEATGTLENTFILFTSDHGEMLQDRGMYQKGVPYESSIRIPFVIRYPVLYQPGSENERFVDLMDIFPTVADLLNIPLPEGKAPLRGGSLLPNTRRAGTRDRKMQLAECHGGRYRWVMSRDERYKFIHYYRGGADYLYDLDADPGESHNLITNTPPGVVEKLKAACLEYEDQWGEPGRVCDGDFVPMVVHEPGEDQDCYPAFDWNNSDKFPRWCFGAFHRFGPLPGDQEAARILFETEASLEYRGGRSVLHQLPIAPEALAEMQKAFVKLGGSPESFAALWKKPCERTSKPGHGH